MDELLKTLDNDDCLFRINLKKKLKLDYMIIKFIMSKS